MKQLNRLLIGFALVALTSPVFAADAAGSITISSPKNDAVIQGAGNKLEFNIHMSPNGNHVHIYVDDQAPIVYRDVSHCPCSIDLPKLSVGKHTIVVKEATSGHAMTGIQGTVTATVK